MTFDVRARSWGDIIRERIIAHSSVTSKSFHWKDWGDVSVNLDGSTVSAKQLARETRAGMEATDREYYKHHSGRTVKFLFGDDMTELVVVLSSAKMTGSLDLFALHELVGKRYKRVMREKGIDVPLDWPEENPLLKTQHMYDVWNDVVTYAELALPKGTLDWTKYNLSCDWNERR